LYLLDNLLDNSVEIISETRGSRTKALQRMDLDSNDSNDSIAPVATLPIMTPDAYAHLNLLG